MQRRQVVGSLGLLALVAVLTIVVAGIASGKAHVPPDEVQVCHKGTTAINVDAPALKGHLGHGDFRLPGCDFGNVFPVGADCSFVSDVDGDGEADAGLNPRLDACGVTSACPAGGTGGPKPQACF